MLTGCLAGSIRSRHRHPDCPTPNKIAELLGVNSPAHRFDHAILRGLLDEAITHPEVKLKRDLYDPDGCTGSADPQQHQHHGEPDAGPPGGGADRTGAEGIGG